MNTNKTKKMSNKKLLFELTEKLESGEMVYAISISEDLATNHILVDTNTEQEVVIWTTRDDRDEGEVVFEYRKELNKEFRENFLKEKNH